MKIKVEEEMEVEKQSPLIHKWKGEDEASGLKKREKKPRAKESKNHLPSWSLPHLLSKPPSHPLLPKCPNNNLHLSKNIIDSPPNLNCATPSRQIQNISSSKHEKNPQSLVANLPYHTIMPQNDDEPLFYLRKMISSTNISSKFSL